MLTEGELSFSAAYVCAGDVLHMRHKRDGGPRGAVLAGHGFGHLCADIAPGGDKRRWALAWKEHVEGSVGAYAYNGHLAPHADGTLAWKGNFTWLGRVHGTFSYTLKPSMDVA